MSKSILQKRENMTELTTASFYAANLFPIQATVALQAEKANTNIVKRLIDVAVSLLLCIAVFSWLFPIIALLIKLTSRGPVFFKQKRTGLNGRHIECYKFRTMQTGCVSVDADGKYLQAIKDDPRTTCIGKILRKTSIDELPQFWNVLIGDMSIVGPRPHPKELNKECEGIVENYHLRNLIKPGITGVAQVKGFRGATPDTQLMQERINHDIWYIHNWSIFLDIRVMVLTCMYMIVGDENAY